MYGSLAGWRTYAQQRGDSTPADETDDDVATAALVRASDYIKYTYVEEFGAGHDDTMSVVEYATYEAATLELATPGFFTKTFTPAEQKVLTKVDTIQWTVVGGEAGPDAARPVSTKIHAMLDRYVTSDDGLLMRSVGA